MDEKRGPRPDGSERSRLIVVAVRVLLLVLAAGAAATAVWMARSHDRTVVGSGAEYVCPMHPDVTSSVAGQCPICGMDLERIASKDVGSGGGAIDPSTYLNYDIMRRRGAGPDAPAPAWVAADGAVFAILYKDELEGLAPEARAVFFVPGVQRPAVAVRAVRAGPDAIVPWDRSTSRVRFRIDDEGAPAGPDAIPAPGQVGRVRLVDRGRELPVIAYSAVLQGADGPYVMVLSADGHTLTRRSIEVGREFGGLALVVSGLATYDRVLTRSAFFIEAERKLRQKDAIEVKR